MFMGGLTGFKVFDEKNVTVFSADEALVEYLRIAKIRFIDLNGTDTENMEAIILHVTIINGLK